MRELGPFTCPLRDYIGYLIPSFPTKNQPEMDNHDYAWHEDAGCQNPWGLTPPLGSCVRKLATLAGKLLRSRGLVRGDDGQHGYISGVRGGRESSETSRQDDRTEADKEQWKVLTSQTLTSQAQSTNRELFGQRRWHTTPHRMGEANFRP